jgi:hypothetical protein
MSRHIKRASWCQRNFQLPTIQTPILARGRIEGRVGVKGRTIALDVVIDQGRVEDVLALAVRAEAPVMTGACR